MNYRLTLAILGAAACSCADPVEVPPADFEAQAAAVAARAESGELTPEAAGAAVAELARLEAQQQQAASGMTPDERREASRLELREQRRALRENRARREADRQEQAAAQAEADRAALAELRSTLPPEIDALERIYGDLIDAYELAAETGPDLATRHEATNRLATLRYVLRRGGPDGTFAAFRTQLAVSEPGDAKALAAAIRDDLTKRSAELEAITALLR